MSRSFRCLAEWGLAGVLVAGCGPGSVTEPQSQVRGVVLVEDTSLPGVVIDLTGPDVRSTTTDSAGRYIFEGVPSGAYVVTVRSVSADISFPATSRTAVVSGAQTVTVDFLGNYIRTASIEGWVTAGTRGLAGVAVTLEGVESGTTRTGQGGGFTFPGLRAGRYQVEISEFPASVRFPSIRTDVDLTTGQTFLVTFGGEAELTASAVIQAIERRLPGGVRVLADPQDLHGDLEVTVAVDRGQDTLEAVELLLDDELVGRQSFTPTQAAPGTGAGGAEGLQAEPLLSVRLPLNTAAFDLATGAAHFPNRQYLLSARLATVEGGPVAWLSSIQVQLRNTDTLWGVVTAENGPVTGADGERWIGGDLEVRVLPVVYDLSRTVESVTLSLRRSGGGELRVLTGEPGSSPLVFPARGDPGPGTLAGYQTPVGETDELVVASARYADGGSVPGVPVVLAGRLRFDIAPPPDPGFALPVQGPVAPCCVGNWVGGDFHFSAAVQGEPDAGVGGGSVSIHVGEASLSDAELAAGPAVMTAAELSPTADNASLRAVAVARDALGNASVVPLAPSEGNPGGGDGTARFGVDLTPPVVEFDATSVGSRARNPAPGSAWVLDAEDPLAGIGPLPARTSVRVSSPALSGTPGQCLFPGPGPCDPVPDGRVRALPAGVEGYITMETRVLDRAGNASAEIWRTVLVDATPPVLGPVSVPGNLVPNEPAAFRVQATDNLDLGDGWFSLEYGDGTGTGREVIAMVPPDPLGTAFDDEMTTDARLALVVPVVAGLERVEDAGGLVRPSGNVLGPEAARAVVTDAAGNRTTRSVPVRVAGEFSARSFSVSERGPDAGVADFTLAAAAERVCRSGGATCGPDVPGSVQLTAAARGLGGAFGRPFEFVHFYVVREGEPEWIATSSSAGLADGVGPAGREWSWSVEWTPAPVTPPGPSVLYAVGVDGDGAALRSADLVSLEVAAGQ